MDNPKGGGSDGKAEQNWSLAGPSGDGEDNTPTWIEHATVRVNKSTEEHSETPMEHSRDKGDQAQSHQVKYTREEIQQIIPLQ